MASLKEIKNRLGSIRNTQKITSAMKMVSSAKLHHIQNISEHSLAYAEKLSGIFNALLSVECDQESPFIQQREVKKATVIVFSSSTGLCGAFNANTIKEAHAIASEYKKKNIETTFFPIGKKIDNELKKAGYQVDRRFFLLADKLNYKEVENFATELQKLFVAGDTDEVVLLYHHFKNMAEQPCEKKNYLPFTIPETNKNIVNNDYILEPSAEELREMIIPKMLNLTLYATVLDTITSEHAARMMAMQTANDNANNLIQELTLQYNKTRQQAITNELLDIMGGIKR